MFSPARALSAAASSAARIGGSAASRATRSALRPDVLRPDALSAARSSGTVLRESAASGAQCDRKGTCAFFFARFAAGLGASSAGRRFFAGVAGASSAARFGWQVSQA